jgi:hypothetical protein
MRSSSNSNWSNRKSSKCVGRGISSFFSSFKGNKKALVSWHNSSLHKITRLDELLKSEEEMYKMELESMRETSEMRKEAMLRRARQLKAAREEERRQYAELQLYKKWK